MPYGPPPASEEPLAGSRCHGLVGMSGDHPIQICPPVKARSIARSIVRVCARRSFGGSVPRVSRVRSGSVPVGGSAGAFSFYLI
jgi:hypothetical protein